LVYSANVQRLLRGLSRVSEVKTACILQASATNLGGGGVRSQEPGPSILGDEKIRCVATAEKKRGPVKTEGKKIGNLESGEQ